MNLSSFNFTINIIAIINKIQELLLMFIASVIHIPFSKFNLPLKYRGIISVFLLWIFIYPQIAKTFHHHEVTLQCSSLTKKHFHIHHEKCLICDFQFSIFIKIFKTFHHSEKFLYKEMNPEYHDLNVNQSLPFYFFLRSPPLKFFTYH
jgi:hypothetical protein